MKPYMNTARLRFLALCPYCNLCLVLHTQLSIISEASLLWYNLPAQMCGRNKTKDHNIIQQGSALITEEPKNWQKYGKMFLVLIRRRFLQEISPHGRSTDIEIYRKISRHMALISESDRKKIGWSIPCLSFSKNNLKITLFFWTPQFYPLCVNDAIQDFTISAYSSVKPLVIYGDAGALSENLRRPWKN